MKQGTFVGDYVEDIKLALVVAAASKQHVVLLGGPGVGKTVMTKYFCKEVYGLDGHVFIRLEASSPPEVVKGVTDIPKLIDPVNPQYALKREGSAYDPAAKAVILDEVGRPMDLVFDVLIDVMDRQDIDPKDAPTVFATSNFMPATSRTEAMRDRFALWVWLKPSNVPAADIVEAHMSNVKLELTLGNHLPTYEELRKVHELQPGPKAIAAVKEVVQSMATLAGKGLRNDAHQLVATFPTTNRRYVQWWKILFYTTALLTGDSNFEQVHKDALKALKWAYPLVDETMAANWARVCEGIQDPADAALAQVARNVYIKFKEGRDRLQNGEVSKGALAVELGRIIAEAKANIDAMGIQTDERVDTVFQELTSTLSKVVAGENPFAKEDSDED